MANLLEDRVTALEASQQNLATKADLDEVKVDLIKWMVGLSVAAIAIQSGLIVGLFSLLAGN